jgi:hypothetical protein
MKLSIKSSEKIEKFYFKDVSEKNYDIELDKEQNIPDGWYELIVPYTGKKIEITDILINDDSMKENIYTGFYVDGKGNKYQPATAVWDEGGYFTIWIHTQPGRIWQRFVDQIRVGDFGTYLFDKYLFTVDRPVKVADYWDPTIKHYFGFGDGPNWWLKNDRFTPYAYADTIKREDYDIDILIKELDSCFPAGNWWCGDIQKKHTKRGLIVGFADLPFKPIEDLPSKMVQDFVRRVGYKRLIDIQLQTLDPKTSLHIHKDHHYHRKCYPYTSGAKKFYWNITDHKDVYFKLGNAGLLPLDKPLFINATEHVHAVVNERTDYRTVLTMYGEL